MKRELAFYKKHDRFTSSFVAFFRKTNFISHAVQEDENEGIKTK